MGKHRSIAAAILFALFFGAYWIVVWQFLERGCPFNFNVCVAVVADGAHGAIFVFIFMVVMSLHQRL